jgi:hypothetical protein
MHFSPIALLINEQLEEYAKLSNSSAVLLMSEDLLVIGNYSISDFYTELCELVGLRFLNIMDSFKLNPVRLDNVKVDINYDTELFVSKKKKEPQKLEQKAKIVMTSFKTSNNIQFYIITFVKNVLNSKSHEDLLPILKNHLSDMIYLLVK